MAITRRSAAFPRPGGRMKPILPRRTADPSSLEYVEVPTPRPMFGAESAAGARGYDLAGEPHLMWMSQFSFGIPLHWSRAAAHEIWPTSCALPTLQLPCFARTLPCRLSTGHL